MSDIQGFLIQVITSAAISCLLAGGLVWLTKSWISERLKHAIKNEYDQKLETHKAQLKAEADVEIERLRSQLNMTAKEHEVRFSRLHEMRAETISETYSRLKQLYMALSEYVKIFEMAGGLPRDKRRDIAVKAHEEFHDYYTTRLIFFPKKIADKLDEINLQLVKTFNEFAIIVDTPRQPPNAIQKWQEIFERVGGAIKSALSDLEDEFRRLLGDDG